MKKILLLCLVATAFMFASCDQGEKYTHVMVSTNLGNMKIKLYNHTPKHRDNFIKLATEGFYDSTLFHRVIPQFMIQGGDPNSIGAAAGTNLGGGGPGYRVDQEIGSPHFSGALAAARDGNPQKASSGSQFYIVTGKPITDKELDQIEQRKGFKYSESQRALYKEVGGTPMLDGEYTVYGEVVEGVEVAEKIAEVARNGGNRPNEDVAMTVKIVN
ncbi:MAG: cyclophilin family peptidyl-prolyl cis-trans isomerase [Paraglaciecola sp.]|jgi:cyclophilin family peptidyl-prolyl cis-trans isomerase